MRIRTLSILLTIFTTIAGLNSALGQADPMSAMAACRSGGPGQITSMKVSGENLPFELRAYSPLLNPGDVYRVTVTGEMAIGDWWFAPSYTADQVAIFVSADKLRRGRRRLTARTAHPPVRACVRQ